CGCGFDPSGATGDRDSPEPGSDAGPGRPADAAPGAPDGAPGAPDAGDLSPILLEVLEVPADGTVVTSTVVLHAGIPYELIALGTVSMVPGEFNADAEFAWDVDRPFIIYDGADYTGDGDLEMDVDYGLGVDDTDTTDGRRALRWGNVSAEHEYSAEMPGTGSTITAKFHDDPQRYGNNSGKLTLEIWGPPL